MPLATPQFGQINIIHQEELCAKQVILHPKMINELSGVNCEQPFFKSQGIESTEVNNGKADGEESLSDNCNIYAVETRTGSEQVQNDKKDRHREKW